MKNQVNPQKLKLGSGKPSVTKTKAAKSPKSKVPHARAPHNKSLKAHAGRQIPDNSIGILGGGQLALMLANAAIRMGIKPIIFAEDSGAPAARVFNNAVFGSTHDTSALKTFFSQVKTVIFENEFVDCKKLKEAASPFQVEFYPKLEVILELQDKFRQKQLLDRLKVPSAEYVRLESTDVSRAELIKCLKKFGGSCVLKWSKLGYDGKGVFVLRDTKKDFELAQKFCAAAAKGGGCIYVERYIPFLRELAVIGVLSTTGEFASYPLVISEQFNGICSRVSGPAVALGVDRKYEILAHQYAEKTARAMNLQGSFAVEFFESQDGRLLVNEIAPRVHNSGHYSQNACATDQFENHLRAVLGWPLGTVASTPGFAMLNILGPDQDMDNENLGYAKSLTFPTPGPRSHIHWYGKSEIRPRRKLGHLNGTVTQVRDMESLLSELETSKQNWITRLKNPRKNETEK